MKSGYLPMLAKSAEGPFSGDDWLFEIKWDGVRAIASVRDELSLKSRNNHELIGQFPELKELVRLAPGTVLDGGIVVMSRGKTGYTVPSPAVTRGRENTFPEKRSPRYVYRIRYP